MTYFSTKTYGHDLGLSCAFRQWRAKSHCRLIHGYSLAFQFTFGSTQLDENGWVVDFGALKDLKFRLQKVFDHKLAVAADDPYLEKFRELEALGLVELSVLPGGVGCERFANLAREMAELTLQELGLRERVWVEKVECREHGANSAIACPV